MEPPLKKVKQLSIPDFFRVRTASDDGSSDITSARQLSSPEDLDEGTSSLSTCEASLTNTELSSLADAVNIPPLSYDIGVLASGLVQVSSISDTDKYNYLTHEYQGTDFATYEVIKKGKRIPLSFQSSWLKEFAWLAYSPSQGGGYCKYCVLFAKPSGKIVLLGSLVKRSFQNFSKAKGKDGYLTTHGAFQFHQDAMIIGKSFMKTYTQPETRIDSIVQKQRQELSDRNKHILSVIVDTVKLCGMQRIPLRGHRDDSTADHATNRGNFMAIIEHTAKSDPILCEHLEQGKKNQRYTSKNTQNELIATISHLLRKKLLEPLKMVRYYSIMADEVTDPHGNQEILSLCLRFIDISGSEPHIKEAFIDFIHLERATGQYVASAILGLLSKYGLDVQNMRGQSFDGASAMAGEKRGAQALIREKNPLAIYTHCRSHVLSLAIGKSCSVQALRNMIGIINEVYLFFHMSPKRQRFLELVLHVCAPESRVFKLKGLCKTRWTERHDCLETFSALYEYIFTTLHAMLESHEYPQIEEAGGGKENWSWDTSTLTKAEGLKHSLKTGSNIVALASLVNGLDPLKGLSAKLQKRDIDVVAAYKYIDTAIHEIHEQRDNFESVWIDWFNAAETIATNIGSEITIPRICKHQKHRASTPADTARDYYRRTVGIPFVDSLLQQLDTRFSEDSRKVKSIMSLVPPVVINLTDSNLHSLENDLHFWDEDLPSPHALKRELQRWKAFWLSKGNGIPQNMVETLSDADVDIFPNIRELLLVGCVSPVGSCEAERSFSVLRHVKTHLRATISEERLAGLTMMAVHYMEAQKMNTEEVVKSYIRRNPRRLFCNSILFDE